MTNLFITILNMSLTGAFVILILCLVRLVLRKSPKIFLYCLWIVVGFRLVFPFSIESALSLMPFSAQLIPLDIAIQPMPYAADPSSGNPLQIWMAIGSSVWLAGAAFMLLRGTISLVTLKRKLREALHVEANIYEAETLKTPFVIGLFSPKIYLPAHLSAQERRYIILHEQTHIRRWDHIMKFVAYFMLCLHWFNPLAWLAFFLMNKDMEMSCDERVLHELGGGSEMKKDYSSALLSLASERRVIGGSALAFTDGDVGSRVRNVLNLKKQSYIVFGVSVLLVLALSVGFSVDRVSSAHSPNDYISSEAAPQVDSFQKLFLCCNY